jgi:acetyl-CoA C-acetyltransferase
MSLMSAYIYEGLRTPFGRHAGALAPIRPDDLLAGVIRAVLARGPFEPDQGWAPRAQGIAAILEKV